MNFPALLEAKRDGQALTREQIIALLGAYTAGKIPDYQMAAMLMAIYFRGLNREETRALTLAMRESGEVLQFPDDPRPLVDKHSTGGVGDKVSLVLAPLLACLGFRVPMISGRGLGITGGTLDKLEAIPGFRTQLSPEQIVKQVQQIGCVICGQTERMAPADKALYALRDVTGTVPSIPLITASILSKKLAESLDALVLDVKFGSAAFMPALEQARELARLLVALGNECGVNTRALLTDMNTPLGRAAGNWLEVKEAVVLLEPPHPVPLPVRRGEGGRRLGEGQLDDLRKLVLDSAAHLLVQTKCAASLEAARMQAEDCLASGTPLRKWEELLAAQGADLKAYHRKLADDAAAPVVTELKAARSGFVSRCDARIIGEIVRDLGGGRLTKETLIQPEVGIDELAKPGESVKSGSVLARIHALKAADAESALAGVKSAFSISDTPPDSTPLILEIV